MVEMIREGKDILTAERSVSGLFSESTDNLSFSDIIYVSEKCRRRQTANSRSRTDGGTLVVGRAEFRAETEKKTGVS